MERLTTVSKAFDDLPGSIQALTLIALAAALSAGVFFYGIPGVVESTWSLPAKKRDLENEFNRLKAEDDFREAVRQRLGEYYERIEVLTNQAETLSSILPDQPEAEQFKRAVYAVGKASGIQIRQIQPQPPILHASHVELPFVVLMDGSYSSLSNFFFRLSRLPRIVSVTGLSLAPPAGGASGAYRIRPNERLGAACVLAAYYRRPQP
jgi:Tfp pilus assembly protein PilO